MHPGFFFLPPTPPIPHPTPPYTPKWGVEAGIRGAGLPQALLKSQKSPILEFWGFDLFQKVRKPYIWEMVGLRGVLYKLGSSPRRPQALFFPTKNRSQDFWTCPIREKAVFVCFLCQKNKIPRVHLKNVYGSRCLDQGGLD